jgi:DNA adenine methylase
MASELNGRARPARALLRYPGSKWSLARWIVAQLPPHRTYVEPFFGSGAVFFTKPPAAYEVLTDLDHRVVNLFRVVRERGAELAQAVALTPWARAEYEAAYTETGDALEDARRFLVRCWQAHGARTAHHTGWKHRGSANGPANTDLWRQLPARILAVVERLQHAEIECRPALEIIARFADDRESLLYVDPPYEPSTRKGWIYAQEMHEADHVALLEALAQCQGAVVLSGYAHPLYEERLRGWQRLERHAVAEKGRRRTEVLWLNRPAARPRQLSFFAMGVPGTEEAAQATERPPLDELKARRQWVVWRYEARPGKPKPGKPLYQPGNGHPARTDRPATWGTFAQASARYRHGGWHGLGFVFTADDPYCGVDLDACRVPLTGEIAPWAWQIVEQLHSYTEVSPSGTGLHILVKATLPGHVGRKQGGIEVYDAGRYFAMTGQRLTELPATIEERQAEIEALYATLAPAEGEGTLPAGRPVPRRSLSRSDEEVLKRARAAENGPKFRALYDQGRIDGYRDRNTGAPDHSAADFALMVLLAYWTNGNAAQMQRLFQASALYRPERWNQPAGGGYTYGEVTIYNALRKERGRGAAR